MDKWKKAHKVKDERDENNDTTEEYQLATKEISWKNFRYAFDNNSKWTENTSTIRLSWVMERFMFTQSSQSQPK